MNAKELAKWLNGNEYGKEITRTQAYEAKRNSLVVIFASDEDIMMWDGLIRDSSKLDMGIIGGGERYLTQDGILLNKCDDDDCPYFAQAKSKAHKIEAVWHAEGEYVWTYQTIIPHETFDILEDGEKYCRGIVFSMDDLK